MQAPRSASGETKVYSVRCGIMSLVTECFSTIFTLHVLFNCVRCNSAPSLSRSTVSRGRRYLVYPPPGDFAPTKVQLILGLGLPMEVDVSMIIGYVMKFNYVLPYNASYLTDPYVRYDRSIDRDVELDGNNISSRNTKGAVMSRWEFYEILELAMESSRSGKACLLRVICETAQVPFNRGQGLAAELIHIILTPSATSEPFRTGFDREYQAAEIAGQRNDGHCDSLFPECPESLLEYFTLIIE